MKVIGVIPSRYNSTRLPAKPLADIHGKPLVQHVYEAASRASCLSDLVVATDDERIAAAVRAFGGKAVLTRADHASGTDRVAEVAANSDAEIVVNVQGDEPLLDPRMIDECVLALQEATKLDSSASLSTVIKKVGQEVYHDPAVVKVVVDARGRALYFSRSSIPYSRQRTSDFAVFEHVGLYAYTRAGLLKLSSLPPSRLEQIECLEQLRALENGISIQTVETRCEGKLVSVDTLEDLELVRRILASGVKA
jgi:3-deoxy-manno-octulosonate cytidylyltransferase (CMP-KDO synthetase)